MTVVSYVCSEYLYQKLKQTVMSLDRREVLGSEQGLVFKKGKVILFKTNTERIVKAIKLVDVSRSGKTATALFKYSAQLDDQWYSIPNVKVDGLIERIIYAEGWDKKL